VKISVTRDHIDRGARVDPAEPIARAIIDAIRELVAVPAHDLHVSIQDAIIIWVTHHALSRLTVAVPSSVRAFMAALRNKGTVCPLEFHIPMDDFIERIYDLYPKTNWIKRDIVVPAKSFPAYNLPEHDVSGCVKVRCGDGRKVRQMFGREAIATRKLKQEALRG
jgi:hypothetical protein